MKPTPPARRCWRIVFGALAGRAPNTQLSVPAVDPLAVAVAELVAQSAIGAPLRHGRAAVSGVMALAVPVVLFVVEAAVGEVATNGSVSIGRILQLAALVEHLVLHLAVVAEPAVGRMVAIRIVEHAVGEPGD